MKEDPEAASDSATEERKVPSNIMINAEGQRVEAVPDMASWEQYKAKAEASAARNDESVADSKELEERGFACPIDKRLFVDPQKTPCCGRTYCHDCIENELVNSDLVCPGCNSEGVLFENLTVDEDMNRRIREYVEEKSKLKAAELGKAKQSPPSSSHGQNKSLSPTPALNPKKRAAEDDLVSDRPKTRSPPGSNPHSPQQKAKSPVKDIQDQQDSTASASAFTGPKSEQDLDKLMNEYARQSGSNDVMGGMPAPNNFPFPIPNMPNFPNMPNMMGMPNPMMMMQNGMNPYMAMMGMMPGSNGMNTNTSGSGMGVASNGMVNGVNNGWNNDNSATPPTGPKAFRSKFSHQQASHGNEDDAYMRKPLNPHRAAYRNRRARPTDYKELGA